VRITADGGYEFAHVKRGDNADVMLDYVGYDLGALRSAYREKIALAGIGGEEAARIESVLEGGLTGYTYLAESG